ncbi:Putative lipid kinase YtlR [Koleobacter methoxysyntrophicus]|jgi:YegS/Rv2252/BmrU family lipid kinase|uniref:Lipid kinase YtlR n=1 Tax=Koleobacter methoxysyntrophicus TaxID=2751313 RepID=A0A8A0RM08_9FIRM|nr:diacylglycerol kinase family protein [Koleobacter methoxysyntrophicus]QSQ08650.1 Putative lipid kinase YtlR [Koleobacter methoxysyntrophicus]
MRCLFIVNPVAGGGRAKRVWERIKGQLEYDRAFYTVLFTGYEGEAIKIVKRERDKYKAVIAVGGDGTVCEVVNGLAGSDTLLGVIPAGSGNDLSKALGIPIDPVQALKAALSGEVREVDLGRIDGRFFINVASSGFDAEVVEEARKTPAFLKPFSYLFAVIKCLFRTQKRSINLIIDGIQYQKEVLLIAVANGKYYGGGMMIAPMARLDDGFFDIIVVNHVGFLEIIRFLPKIFSGGHMKHAKVEHFKGREIQMLSEERIPVQSDGEILGHLPYKIEMVPRAVKILVPRE